MKGDIKSREEEKKVKKIAGRGKGEASKEKRAECGEDVERSVVEMSKNVNNRLSTVMNCLS